MSEELYQPEYCPHCGGVVGIDCDDINACHARHITPPPGYVFVPVEPTSRELNAIGQSVMSLTQYVLTEDGVRRAWDVFVNRLKTHDSQGTNHD